MSRLTKYNPMRQARRLYGRFGHVLPFGPAARRCRREWADLRPCRPVRVVYQPYVTSGACGIIDRGFFSGLEDAGAQVVLWNADQNNPPLSTLLKVFRPTHFAGYLQRQSRDAFGWLSGETRETLLKYKNSKGLKVAACSVPSNIRDVYGDWVADFTRHHGAGTSSYYGQADRPTPVERELFESGLVDLVTTRYCVETIERLYKNFLDLDVPILVQPPAAESCYFHDAHSEADKDIDILFVGNCWPFKWHNMEQYVVPLKRRLGDRFRLFGEGWPEGISEGPLDDASYLDYVKRAKINLGFHEPSQVLSFGTSTNERVFKLLSMSAFVISDPCAAFRYYFRDGEHLVLARSGEEIVQQVDHYLRHPEQRAAIAQSGREHVMREHTYEQRAKRLFDVLDSKGRGIYDYVSATLQKPCQSNTLRGVA